MVVPKTAEEEEREREAATSPAAAFAFNTLKRPRKTTKDASTPDAYMQMYHPEEADSVLSVLSPEDWLPVTMLSLLPHIEVMLSPESTASAAGASEETHSALLMVDTGAGGMGAMLNAKAATTMGLLQPENKNDGSGNGNGTGGNRKSIRGVGGSATSSVTLKTGHLGSIKVGSQVEFEGVQCLITPEGAGGGASLSYYSSGIICGELLSKCRLVVDLARGRMAVLPAQRSTRK